MQHRVQSLLQGWWVINRWYMVIHEVCTAAHKWCTSDHMDNDWVDDKTKARIWHSMSVLLHYFSSLHLLCQLPVVAAPVHIAMPKKVKRGRPARSPCPISEYPSDEGEVVEAVQPISSIATSQSQPESQSESQSQFESQSQSHSESQSQA